MSQTHRPDRSTRRPRVAGALGVVTLTLGLGLAACGGGSSSSVAAPPTTVPDDVVIATDPNVPIVVELGHRFSVVLPADPGDGWRWTVEPFDTARLAALGSEFSDDDARRAAAVTVTTIPPTTPTTPTTVAPGRGPTTSTTSTVPPAETPAPPAVPPLVQIISFAGRAAGTTTVSFRAAQIVATSPAPPAVVRWTVEIVPAVVGPR